MKQNRSFLPQPITFWPVVCRLVLIVCLGPFCGTNTTVVAAPLLQGETDLTAEQIADLGYHASNLKSPTTTPPHRARAAHYLVRMRIPEAVLVLDEALRGGDREMISAVLLALQNEPVVPGGLLEGLTGVLAGADEQRIQRIAGIVSTFGDRGARHVAAITGDQAADPQLRLGAVRALGHLRNTDVARTSVDSLVRLVQPDQATSPELAAAAFAGLVALTNETTLGNDPIAWQQWWAARSDLPVREWLPDETQRLTDQVGVLRQALGDAQAQNTIYHDRLQETLSDLYFQLVSVSDEAMYARMAEWIRDDFDPIRRFAVNRADSRVLENTEKLSTGVDQALAERLADTNEQPEIRRTSARILDRRDFARIGPLVAAAIDPTADTNALQEYLSILERRPTIEALPALQDILTSANGPRDRAARCVLGMIDAGLMEDDTRQKTREAARAGLERAATPDVITLLARVGVEDDISRLLPLLDHSDGSIRSATANALTSNSVAREDILSRAGHDAAVYPAALAIHAAGSPTIEHVNLLVAATPPDTPSVAAWETEVRRFGARVPIADLGTVDSTLVALPNDHPAAPAVPALRETILARLTTMPPDALPAPERSALLLTLARLREALGRPAGVIAALDAINGNGSNNDGERSRLRLTAFLWLEQFDNAFAVDANPDSWLTVFNSAVGTEDDLAKTLKGEIERRFPDLAGPQLEEFNAIVARIDDETTPPDPGGGDASTESGGT